MKSKIIEIFEYALEQSQQRFKSISVPNIFGTDYTKMMDKIFEERNKKTSYKRCIDNNSLPIVEICENYLGIYCFIKREDREKFTYFFSEIRKIFPEVSFETEHRNFIDTPVEDFYHGHKAVLKVGNNIHGFIKIKSSFGDIFINKMKHKLYDIQNILIEYFAQSDDNIIRLAYDDMENSFHQIIRNLLISPRQNRNFKSVEEIVAFFEPNNYFDIMEIIRLIMYTDFFETNYDLCKNIVKKTFNMCINGKSYYHTFQNNIFKINQLLRFSNLTKRMENIIIKCESDTIRNAFYDIFCVVRSNYNNLEFSSDLGIDLDDPGNYEEMSVSLIFSKNSLCIDPFIYTDRNFEEQVLNSDVFIDSF